MSDNYNPRFEKAYEEAKIVRNGILGEDKKPISHDDVLYIHNLLHNPYSTSSGFMLCMGIEVFGGSDSLGVTANADRVIREMKRDILGNYNNIRKKDK